MSGEGGPGPARCPHPTRPGSAIYLSAPLLDVVAGQWALDAAVPPQEHLSLVGLIELRLCLGLGGVHTQADHLGEGSGSSGCGTRQ